MYDYRKLKEAINTVEKTINWIKSEVDYLEKNSSFRGLGNLKEVFDAATKKRIM